MDKTSTTFSYRVKALRGNDRFVTLKATGVAGPLRAVTPPEFPKGIAGEWSPETLLLSAVASCYITTFEALADKFGFQPAALECEAVGTIGMVEGKYAFTGITLYPVLTLLEENQEATALKILEKAHRYCLISNSLNCPVSVQEQVVNEMAL